jgi:ribosomal 50S subunit-associated protein YjgA (DUF615 family)
VRLFRLSCRRAFVFAIALVRNWRGALRRRSGTIGEGNRAIDEEQIKWVLDAVQWARRQNLDQVDDPMLRERIIAAKEIALIAVTLGQLRKALPDCSNDILRANIQCMIDEEQDKLDAALSRLRRVSPEAADSSLPG